MGLHLSGFVEFYDGTWEAIINMSPYFGRIFLPLNNRVYAAQETDHMERGVHRFNYDDIYFAGWRPINSAPHTSYVTPPFFGDDGEFSLELGEIFSNSDGAATWLRYTEFLDIPDSEFEIDLTFFKKLCALVADQYGPDNLRLVFWTV